MIHLAQTLMTYEHLGPFGAACAAILTLAYAAWRAIGKPAMTAMLTISENAVKSEMTNKQTAETNNATAELMTKMLGELRDELEEQRRRKGQ